MRSPRKAILERIHQLCDDSDRFVDAACRVRVFRRGANGNAAPAELLSIGYGGVYDRFAARYSTEHKPKRVLDLKIHQGQLPLIQQIGSAKRRILCLGSPGGGKSMGIITVAVILCLRRANSIGGIIAPTRQRLDIVWRKFLELVEPAGLIGHPDDISPSKREIKLINGTVVQFRAAARRSAGTGSPIAGHDWHWACEDEQQDIDDDSIREVDARGRITATYQVFSSATNEARHEFQMRLREYEKNPEKAVLRFSGPDNCFTPLEHWEALRRNWSPEEYDRYINCIDVPREGRVYPQFSYQDHTQPLPTPSNDPRLPRDITAEITAAKFRVPYAYVVGWDPGVVASASVILKCYSNPGTGKDERQWFVLDEVTTRDATTEWHAKDLAQWFARRGIPLDQVLVLGDPHEDKQTDRSDYLVMQAAGFTCKRSNAGIKIERKHRLAMLNALLRDAGRRIRLRLVASPAGPPQAGKLAECLGHLMYLPSGEIDFRHKTYLNLAHWGDALGYALFPFEQFRGSYKPHGTGATHGA